MARRKALLALALVVALFGTAAVFTYVQSVDERAIADAQPVEVLVAKELIPVGTTGQQASEQGLLSLLTVPRKATPLGVLSDIQPIAEDVALSDIFPGEMLLQAKFGDQQSTGALAIPAGKMAISVELGDPQRVAGFVQPGSEVAVFVTFETEPQAPAPTSGQPGLVGTAGQATRLLLPRLPVVAVGPTTLKTLSRRADDSGDQPVAQEEVIPTAILTVAVSQAEAEKLVHAAQTAQLYFGLLSADSATSASAGVDNRTLFS